MAKLDDLKALQAQAAAAVSRSPSVANQRKLRKAQEALTAERDRVKIQKGRNRPEAADPTAGLEQAVAAAPPAPGLNLKDPNVARYIQTQLKNAGFYKGRIDGKWGPKSEAANKAWNDAGRPDAAAAAERGVPAPMGGGGDSGGGGGGVVGVSAPSAAAPTSAPSSTLAPGDFRARVLAEIPSAAAFLNIPELVPILQRRLDGTISSQEFAAQVQGTDWYRTTPGKSRAWLGLYALDPATAERQIDNQLGEVKKIAGAYMVPLADVTAREWAKKVLSGEIPEGGFLAYVKEQAKSLFPTLSGAIDAGVTVEQYADPYKQLAAKTLEIAPESVNLMDPKWSRALMQIDPKTGQRTAMSLSDWQTTIRTDAAYGYDNTNQARGQAAQFSTELARMFGKVA